MTGASIQHGGEGVKNDVVTSEDPAAGVSGDTQGEEGRATGDRAWKVGWHLDNLLITYQPRQRIQSNGDILTEETDRNRWRWRRRDSR